MNSIAGALLMAKPMATQETQLGILQVGAGHDRFGAMANGHYSSHAEALAYAGEGHGAFASGASLADFHRTGTNYWEGE